MPLGSNRGAGVWGRAAVPDKPLDLGSLADDPSDGYPAHGRCGTIPPAYGYPGPRPLYDRMGPRFAGEKGVS
jgi:hypothetical protein